MILLNFPIPDRIKQLNWIYFYILYNIKFILYLFLEQIVFYAYSHIRFIVVVVKVSGRFFSGTPCAYLAMFDHINIYVYCDTVSANMALQRKGLYLLILGYLVSFNVLVRIQYKHSDDYWSSIYPSLSSSLISSTKAHFSTRKICKKQIQVPHHWLLSHHK
jgi:hypothetical protein